MIPDMSPDVRAIGLDPAQFATVPELIVVLRHTHRAKLVVDHLPALPLCWVADGAQRGATVEEWEVTFDHVIDPAVEDGEPIHGPLTDNRHAVTCPECREWQGA